MGGMVLVREVGVVGGVGVRGVWCWCVELVRVWMDGLGVDGWMDGGGVEVDLEWKAAVAGV